MKTMSTPQQDAIVIDARLLLDYEKIRIGTYVSVGVQSKDTRLEPYHTWLCQAMNMDIEAASELQVARDNRLTQRLFADKAPVSELSSLDLVHLFIESGSRVFVTSFETPDALDAIVARAGLPETVTKLALRSKDRCQETVSSILNSELAPRWLLVYELGLTPKVEQRIVQTLGQRGVLVNIKGSPRQTYRSDEHLIDLVNERWSYM